MKVSKIFLENGSGPPQAPTIAPYENVRPQGEDFAVVDSLEGAPRYNPMSPSRSPPRFLFLIL